MDLKHNNTISDNDYKNIVRPDVMLLKTYPTAPKFQNNKFWSIATLAGNQIPSGYKMKWHNLGNGNVQLRLPVAMGVTSDAILCEA